MGDDGGIDGKAEEREMKAERGPFLAYINV